MLLRTLTLLTFLLIIIPGDKLSFPVGLMLIIPFLGIASFNDILLVILPLAAVIYSIITIKRQSPKDLKINILTLIIFYAFLLFFTKNFIQYSNPLSLSTLILFLTISLTNLIQTIKKLNN